MQHKIIHINNPRRWSLVSRLSLHSRKHKRLMRFADSRSKGKTFNLAEACSATGQGERAMTRRLDWLTVIGVLVKRGNSYRLASDHAAAAHHAEQAELRA